ncbi:MAG: hypothetical protein RL607_2250 [Bacteroidota bacterium]|jgi:iron complex transport system ATP-binding protein
MENKVVTTSQLAIGYASKKNILTLASGLNITLEAGKLISLVGPNGAGKSTLLRTLCGLQPALEGEVFIQNQPIAQLQPEHRAQQLALVLTEKIPMSNLTVYELIALGRQPYTNWLGQLTEDDKYHISRAIEHTEVSAFQHKKHFEISDGQLQRVLIARALAQNTPWMVLDEPTTHLDLVHKVSVFRLLKKLAKETHKCILFSTHDIDLAIQLSDEMIVMTTDQIVLDQPCNHISSGIFTTLFQDENIHFDPTTGRFIIA